MYSNLGYRDGEMEKTEWEKLEHDNYIQKIMDLSRQDSKVHNKIILLSNANAIQKSKVTKKSSIIIAIIYRYVILYIRYYSSTTRF